ncbi:hypothetical protein EDC04DRAFT_2889153 [Pisolithus marmoratus]|nr:hypothetical protein EDC04DRAFT_2889153 [Pisolithus marmoratus]
MSEAPASTNTPLDFPEASCATSLRNLKRRLSSSIDPEFFASISPSLNSKPYDPNAASSHTFNAPKSFPPTRSHSSAHLAPPIPVMDPSPSDPNAVFIHPPFVDFPNSHLYPEGLSYSLMAANPEWFLDQNDFISSLEPPRGWCPAKKKDLKALGPDGWPDGEEPRLRCTFCRRTYAGVNAKSMWRRHVYEKHKIAMSNRRDHHDRTRGRRATHKDHRQGTSDKENLSDDPRRSVKHSELCSTKSKARSPSSPSETFSSNLTGNPAAEAGTAVTPSTPLIEQAKLHQSHHRREDEQVPVNEEFRTGPVERGEIECHSQPKAEGTFPSPKTTKFLVPLSPYDPTLTPSFRHSPPRLPSDQPWRFPSPSHPLHSKAREMCLSMLVRGGASPVVKGDPTGSLVERRALGDLAPVFVGGNSPVVFRPSPRQLFTDGRSPISTFNHLDYRKRLNDSPLGGGLRRRSNLRKKSTIASTPDVQNGWLSDASLSSAGSMTAGSPARLTPEDPFGNLYKPLLQPKVNDGVHQRSPELISSDEAGSPVVRKTRPSVAGAAELEAGVVGLGIGLMAPFTLSTPRMDSFVYDEADELEVEKSLTDTQRQHSHSACDEGGEHEDMPPMKRRRQTTEKST